MDRRDLKKVVNDEARRVKIRGNQAIVPLKFDEDGEVVSETTPSQKVILKHLTLKDLSFLKVWKESEWNITEARAKSNLEESDVDRLVKKLQCFRDEDAKVKALAEIPTASWITAKHVENVYEGGRLEDSEHKSLAELAKISGAYKTVANLSITQNVFNLPQLTPEVEAKFKRLAEEAMNAEQVA